MNIFKHKKFKKPAFTITEAVITLAVIGILWSLSVVIFIPKTKDMIIRHQMKAAKMKLTKAMEVMNINGKITSNYSSTQDFVNVLKKYLAIQKICDSNHLSECFDYETLRLKDGTTLDLADLKDGSGFHVKKTDEKDFTGDTVGIRTLDGTSMVLAWNKNCKGLKPGVYSWSGDTNKTTGCLIALIDANGDDTPNIMGKDIAYFNLSNEEECGIEFTIDGKKYCWSEPFAITTPLSASECNAKKDELGIDFCNTHYSDYWGGAVKACGGRENMPTPDDLTAFKEYLYGLDDESATSLLTYTPINTTALANASSSLLAFYNTNQEFCLWSDAYYRSEDWSQSASTDHPHCFRSTYNLFADNVYEGNKYDNAPSTVMGVCVLNGVKSNPRSSAPITP